MSTRRPSHACSFDKAYLATEMDRVPANIQTANVWLLILLWIRAGLQAFGHIVEPLCTCLIRGLVGVQPQKCAATAQSGFADRSRSTEWIHHQVIGWDLNVAPNSEDVSTSDNGNYG